MTDAEGSGPTTPGPRPAIASMAPAGWSARELATLAAIAETFVRGGAVRRANVAATALETATDPAQLRQLRLVLRVVESRVANLLLDHRPTPFRDMSPAAREQYLAGWARSRIPQRRAAVGAFRRLLTFLAYADPGESGTNPRWKSVGYEWQRPPTAARPTNVRPITPDAAADGAVHLDADVVIVGSGAGGGVVAADLSRAGRSVVVLDAGPFVDETSMPQGELEGFDRLYLDHGLTATWDGSVTLLAGSAVGGGTVINWMTCVPPPDDVRSDWATAHGLDGVDTAAFAAELATLEQELSVAPATSLPPKDVAILRAADALGWRSDRIRRNSPGCDDCGSCGFGCPRGTKQSGLRAHLATATGAGARVVANARVERVLLEAGRATGVDGRIDVDGTSRPLVVRARQVVVAAGALRTPTILARSGLEHPAIGRHLRVHPVPVVAAQVRDSVRMWTGTTQGARVDEFTATTRDRNGYVIESVPAHPGLLALALPWDSADGHAAVMERAASLVPLIAVTRDGGEGRVTPTKAGGTRIDYRLDATGVSTLRHALVSMARLGRAMGAVEIVAVGTPPAIFGRDGVPSGGEERAFRAFEAQLERFDFRPNRGGVYSAHQMGTCRMGGDAATHACDTAGHVRRGRRGEIIGGLYVADTSLFPTGIGVNPMMTVMALARRVARTVAAEA